MSRLVARRAALAAALAAVLAACGARDGTGAPALARSAYVSTLSFNPAPPATLKNYECVPLAVQANGQASVDIPVSLTWNSGSGELYSDALCTTSLYSGLNAGLVIPAGASVTQTVYLRQVAPGSSRVTASGLSGGSSGSYLTATASYTVVDVGLALMEQPPASVQAGTPVTVRMWVGGSKRSETLHVQLEDLATPVPTSSAIRGSPLTAAAPGFTSVTFTPTAVGQRFQLYAFTPGATDQARSAEFAVTPAAPATLTAPADLTEIAGEYISTFSVSVVDAYGNPVPATTITVASRYPDSSPLTGETQVLTGDTGVAEFATLATTTAGSTSLAFTTAEGLVAYTPVTVSPGPPTLAFVQQPGGSYVAGASVDAVAELRDRYGNSRYDYVTLGLEDGAGTWLSGQQTWSTDFAGASFTITRPGTWYVRVTDGGWTARSGPIVVSPAAPYSLSLSLPQWLLTAGQVFSAVATVRDQFENPVAATVTLSLGAANDGVLHGTLSRATSATTGQVTFDDLHVEKAGTYWVSSSVPGLVAGYSPPLSISAGTPIPTVTPTPAGLTADDTFGATVQVQDTHGNPVYPSAVTIFLDPANGGTLEGTTTGATSVAGAAVFPGLAIRKAGAGYRIAVRLGSGQTGTTGLFDVAPGTPDLAGFTLATAPPANLVAGEPFPVAVRLVDTHGNPISTTVSLTVEPGATLSGGTSAPTAVATGVASFPALSIPQAGSHALTASVTSPVPLLRTSDPIAVAAAPASSLVFVAPPPPAATADEAFPVSLSLSDAYGNVVDGTVTLALVDDVGAVPFSAAVEVLSTPTSGGLARFPEVAVRRAGGPYHLLATLAAPALTATSSALAVAPGVATALAFTAPPPAAVAAGDAFTVGARVTDAWVNPISTQVELTLGAANGAALSGTLALATDPSGVATFAGLSVERAGTGYTLTATTASPALAASALLDVTPATAIVTVLGGPPATLTADASFAVTVQVRDAWANPVPTTVTLGLDAANGATLAGAVPAATDGAGIARFPEIAVRRAGAGYQVAARTAGGQVGKGAAFEVTPATPAPSGLTFTAAPPTTILAGDPFDAAVQLVDPYGNPIATTVRLALEPAGTSLAGTTARDTDGSGVAPFPGLSIATAGTYTLRAAVTSPVSLSVARPVAVAPAAASRLVFVEQPPSTPTADDEFRVALRVADRFDNPVDATVAVTILSAAGDAVLEVTTTSVALAAPTADGVAVLPHLSVRKAGGPYQLLASVAAPALAATSADVAVGAGAVSRLRFPAFSASTGQQGVRLPPVKVAVEDAWANVVPDSTTPVSLGLDGGPAGATLSGGEARAPDRGVASFANLVVSRPGTYRLHATRGELTAQAPVDTVVLAPGSTSPAHHLAYTVTPPAQVLVGTCSDLRVEVHDEGTPFVAPQRISMTSVVTAELSQAAGLTFHGGLGCDADPITTTEIGLSGISEFHVKARQPGSYTVAVYANLSGQNGSTIGLRTVARDLAVVERMPSDPLTSPATSDQKERAKPLNGWGTGCGAGGAAPSAVALLALAAVALRRRGKTRPGETAP